jgi:hypothetical protein
MDPYGLWTYSHYDVWLNLIYDTMIWRFSNIGLPPNHPKLDSFFRIETYGLGIEFKTPPLFTIISRRLKID